MITRSVPARVGLLGNPSDGYGGRTLALAVAGMEATVSVAEGSGVRIHGPRVDPFGFDSTAELAAFVDRYGYGSGEQLLAATVRTFMNLADTQGWDMPAGVHITFDTTIPRAVGLAGSSALVIALLRCLLDLTGHELDDRLVPALALSVEVDQLHLVGGLQDRVVQSFGGLMAMDFGSMSADPRTGLRFGTYERLDASSLPRLFLAYAPLAAEPSSRYHSVLRSRYEASHPATLDGLHELAALVTRGKAAMAWGGEGFGGLLTRNMDLRTALAPVPEKQLRLIEAARDCGLDATFAGSGGAIVGVLDSDDQVKQLRARLGDLHRSEGEGNEAVVKEIRVTG